MLSVNDLMNPEPRTVRPDDSLSQAAQALWDGNCGGLPVVDDELHPVGFLTDRDIAMSGAIQGLPLHDLTVSSSMTGRCVTVAAGASMKQLHGLMREHKMRRLPVVDASGVLVGVVSVSDLISYGASKPRATKEAAELRSTLSVLSHSGLAERLAAPKAKASAKTTAKSASKAAGKTAGKAKRATKAVSQQMTLNMGQGATATKKRASRRKAAAKPAKATVKTTVKAAAKKAAKPFSKAAPKRAVKASAKKTVKAVAKVTKKAAPKTSGKAVAKKPVVKAAVKTASKSPAKRVVKGKSSTRRGAKPVAKAKGRGRSAGA